MKMAMAALAAVLMAQAAPAAAQWRGDRGDRGDRQERPAGRDEAQPDRDSRGGSRWVGRGAPAPTPEAAVAPQPPRAQPAPQADRPRFRGDGRYARPGGQDLHDRRADVPRADLPRGGGRRDEGRRDDGRRDWGGRGDNDRRDWDRRDNDRRDWGRRDDDRRRWDGRDDRRRWERGRYPPAYASAQRYRYAWRPPSGFYLRSWSFGEVFPRGWYGPGRWIDDPWQYELPLPPPGYEWVRSGPDALLIDEFNGRIVQIVRDAFWY
ncbi:MAG TPA: RcnB family protein [Phenylobacterium sp.]